MQAKGSAGDELKMFECNCDSEVSCFQCKETKLVKYCFFDKNQTLNYICDDTCLRLYKNSRVEIIDLTSDDEAPPRLRVKNFAKCSQNEPPSASVKKCAACNKIIDNPENSSTLDLMGQVMYYCNDICLRKPNYCGQFGDDVRHICANSSHYHQETLQHRGQDGFIASAGQRRQSEDWRNSYDLLANDRPPEVYPRVNCSFCFQPIPHGNGVVDENLNHFCGENCITAFRFVKKQLSRPGTCTVGCKRIIHNHPPYNNQGEPIPRDFQQPSVSNVQRLANQSPPPLVPLDFPGPSTRFNASTSTTSNHLQQSRRIQNLETPIQVEVLEHIEVLEFRCPDHVHILQPASVQNLPLPPIHVHAEQQYEDQQYEDQQYEDRQYEDRQYEDRQYEDRQYEDRQYEDRQYEDRQYEDQQYEDRQYEDRQYEERQYEDQQYEDRQYEDHQYEDQEPFFSDTSRNTSIATQVNRTTRDACIQTEQDDSMKIIVPVPVPIYVPTPCHMFSTPVPIPVPFPLPIPVPIFIPNTQNNAAEIVNEVNNEDQDKDVMNHEAEAVAEKEEEPTDSQNDLDNNAAESDGEYSFEAVGSTDTFRGDMPQTLVPQITTGLDEPAVDVEEALTGYTITASQDDHSPLVVRRTSQNVDDFQPMHPQLMKRSPVVLELDEPAVDLERALPANTATASQNGLQPVSPQEENVDDPQPMQSHRMERGPAVRDRKRRMLDLDEPAVDLEAALPANISSARKRGMNGDGAPGGGQSKRVRRMPSLYVDLTMMKLEQPAASPGPQEEPNDNRCPKCRRRKNPK